LAWRQATTRGFGEDCKRRRLPIEARSRAIVQGTNSPRGRMSLAAKKAVVVPLAFAALGVLATAHVAIANHPRPVSGAMLRVSLVPSYQQCISPNRMHGPPL